MKAEYHEGPEALERFNHGTGINEPSGYQSYLDFSASVVYDNLQASTTKGKTVMDEQTKKLQHPSNWQYGSPLDCIAEEWAQKLCSSESGIIGRMNHHIFHDIKAYFIAAVKAAAPIKSSWIELRHEVAWKPIDMLWMLRNNGIKVIHADRQTGKTTEMLKYAVEKYGLEFICVSPNGQMSDNARSLFWCRCAPIDVDQSLHYPSFIPVRAVSDRLRGHNLPVFVDEWGKFSQQDKNIILEANFQKAVTS